MKKEITAIINADRGYLRLDKTVTLHRWTEDAVGEKVDKLEAIVHFLFVPDEIVELTSRTYTEVVAEIANAVQNAYSTVGARLAAEITNGHVTLEADFSRRRIVRYEFSGIRDLTLAADYNTDSYSPSELEDLAKTWEKEDNDGTRYIVEEY